MFEIYPGFEDLPLRVEVDWQGQKRMVIARLEQWPDSDKAVVVCAFADDSNDGEWIITGGHLIPYQINPYNLVSEAQIYEIKTRQPVLQWKHQSKRREQVEQIVCKSFGNHKNFSVARLLRLDDLALKPRVALRTLSKSVWMPNYSHESWVEFEGKAQIELTEIQEQSRLIMDCQNEESDAHFAWEWMKLNDEQRENYLGFVGDRQELERVMSLVLAARNHDWKQDDCLIWQFDVNIETGQFYGSFDIVVQYSHTRETLDLSLWDELLLARCAPNWRAELVEHHECVRQYLASKCYEFGYAIRNQPPTAHEQLEAKLALRDWLRDAATPDVAAVLLASLDD